MQDSGEGRSSSGVPWHRHWFVVKEASVVPFVPLKYLKRALQSLKWRAGLHRCLIFVFRQCRQKDLDLSADQAKSVSLAAFTAGFWVRVSGATYTKYTSSFHFESETTGCCVVPRGFLILSWFSRRQSRFSLHRIAKRSKSWKSFHPLLR